MSISVSLPGGLSLHIGEAEADAVTDGSLGAAGRGGRYPTASMRKGLRLRCDGRDLAEEGVGFGVPILKRGVQTIFPGTLELATRRTPDGTEVTATFGMDLVERLARGGGTVEPRLLYAAKDALAALHRRAPVLRGPLTVTSGVLRRGFGLRTTYAPARPVGTLRMTYGIDGAGGRLRVALEVPDLRREGVTEVVVMNEQGARSFDLYADSGGVELSGDEVGTWDAVTAARAGLASSTCGAMFSLGRVGGARLFRGRELIGSRLSWVGFGYSLPPVPGPFTYDVRFARLP